MKKILALLLITYASQASGQNYTVNFTGTGESASVATVKVENLTTGATLEINGTDLLRLTLPTGIDEDSETAYPRLALYPNPMSEYSDMMLPDHVYGEAKVLITDISGKVIYSRKIYNDSPGKSFRISGLKNGVYIINVNAGNSSLSGRLVSVSNANGSVHIEDISNSVDPAGEKIRTSFPKGLAETVDMPYNNGERLKFTGISGDFTTIVTSDFASDKEIIFKFVRCKDGDNRNYPVTEVGTQTWMAVNLGTESYSNGDLIGTTDPQTLNISTAVNPKYVWVYYAYMVTIDPLVNGRLYTWHAAVDSRGLCPTGWHLPTRDEWNTLFTTLGGATIAGGKLKETTFAHWESPNTDANNFSGFTAIPTGTRAPAGSCTNYTKFSSLWSSTEKDATYAWYCALGYNFGAAYSDVNTAKNVGLGVRCIKD